MTKEDKKDKVGRPKKEVSELWDGWYKDILELYEMGASDVEVKALIYTKLGSFSNDLWDRWLKEEPEFSETIKVGKLISESWWQKKGRTELGNKEFSYTGWYMNMKNRFKWTDRQETENVNTNVNADAKGKTREELIESIMKKTK